MIKIDFKNLCEGFFNLFYPTLCEVCDNPLVANEKIICTTCRYNIPKTNFWLDYNNDVYKVFWGRVNIEKACSYYYFNKGSGYRKLIHKLKYKGFKDIGIQLGYYFGAELNKSQWCDGIDLIVPVPLHIRKQRARGYNQSECIAQGIASVCGLHVITKSLLKVLNTKSQTQKGRMERWENVLDSFEVARKELIENKHILLVDDVITTGSTLEACATVLKSACNCKVSIATLAYAPL